MKYFVLLCVLFLLVDISVQIPKYENCDRQVLTGNAVKDCVRVTCLNKKDYKIKSCEKVMCEKGKQVGYHNGDPHSEFPDCCSYPICKK